MLNLYTLSFNELADLLQQWGQPAYRAKQVWGWLYERFETDFDNMLNLPANLRDRLKAETTIGSLTTVTEQNSTDGTRKRLYRLPDGQMIEAVLMTYDDQRRTACISTQAGCAMGCVFCATGQMGFARHLTATEILEQALIFASELHAEDDRLSNIVLMGMGEPFHNYDESLRAMHRLMNDVGIGARHITVSTVGIAPKIRQFADEGLQINLAISLHAATDTERSDLLPVNRRWDLHELMAACRYYIGKTGRRLTFEWALIHGETDTEEQAHALGKLLQGMLCHVNAIPLNPTDGYNGGPSGIATADKFQQILESYGVSMTVRVRRGINIDAGCGQLSAKVNAPVTIAVEDVD